MRLSPKKKGKAQKSATYVAATGWVQSDPLISGEVLAGSWVPPARGSPSGVHAENASYWQHWDESAFVVGENGVGVW